MKKISSVNNEEVKEVVKLAKAGKRKKEGLFVVEGQREIYLAYEAGYQLDKFYYCPELHTKKEYDFLDSGEQITELTKPVFEKMAYKENPDGCLAVFVYQSKKLTEIKLSDKPLVIVLEAVEKPGNLGAILRTAFAVKADAVIVNDPQTDLLNPNVIRASMGHIFTNQVVVSSVEETITWLRKHNIKSFASSLEAKKEYTDVNFRAGTAVVMGTENSGLSRKWLRGANELICIPMQPGIDSLNVSVSTAIISYEVLRQRK